MSGKATGMVWELDIPHNEQFVLLAMADHADHNGGHIFTSTAELAWKTGYSQRQIQRIIKTLRDKKIIELTKAKYGRYGTNCYRILWANAPKKEPLEREEKETVRQDYIQQNVTPDKMTYDISAGSYDIQMSPDPSDEPSINTSLSKVTSMSTSDVPSTVENSVASKSKPKRPAINQCLKDAIAIHMEGIAPNEGTELTGLLANKAAAVWQRKLDMPHLTGEHYASIARSIPAYVAWFKDNNSGYTPSKDLKKFESEYAKFVSTNGKTKAQTVEDNYIDDPDRPGVKITRAQLETRRRNAAIIEAEHGKAS